MTVNEIVRSRRRLVAGALSLPLALGVAGAAFGSSGVFVDNQANSPQVAGGQVSDTVPFPTNKQNEPSIAVSRTRMELAGTGPPVQGVNRMGYRGTT